MSNDLSQRIKALEARIRELTRGDTYPSTEIADIEHIGDRDAFFRRVIESAVDGLYVYDLELQSNVYINPRYTELTGYSLGEINSFTQDEFLQLFHPDDLESVLAHMGDVTASKEGDVVNLEYRFKTKAGPWLWCLSHDIAFARTEDGTVRQFLGSFIDIAEQKQAQLRLERSNADLEQFAYAASHDLKAPLRAIQNVSAWLAEDLPPSAVTTEVNEHLELLRSRASRMDALIDGLLHYSQVGHSGDEEEVDSGHLVRDIT